MLSKFSGGIGLAYSPRALARLADRGTNGHSNGIVPWLKTLDASVAAVNQGGKRKGACCVYLEPWHADIEEFLELRDNTGDEARRTHNLNLANWIPDLFMRRVEADGDWSPVRSRGRARAARPVGRRRSTRAYAAAEAAGLVVQARSRRASCTRRMMRTLAQTGNGWMTFKDASNRSVQPDRRSPAAPCTSRTCAPRSSRSRATARRRSATSARSTSARHVDATAAIRLRAAARAPCAPPCASSTA